MKPMPERRSTAIAAWLCLCMAALAPARGAAEPAVDGAFTLGLSIEMAAHRRLMGVMENANHTPAPFTTDGCSGGLSMAWDLIADLLPAFAATHEEHPPWEACCVTHDRAYHSAGGAREAEASYRARLAADKALRDCVLDTGGRRTQHLAQTYGVSDAQIADAYGLIADAMFDAVRLGGGPCSGMPWRWGYGYPGCLLSRGAVSDGRTQTDGGMGRPRPKPALYSKAPGAHGTAPQPIQVCRQPARTLAITTTGATTHAVHAITTHPRHHRFFCDAALGLRRAD